MSTATVHDATASALGFRYQERVALLQLLNHHDDEAAVSVETLDDVHFKADGTDLIEQVKHSIAANPAAIDIKSPNLWSTLRIWCGLLDSIDVHSTKFVLVTVAPLTSSSALSALCEDSSDRSEVLTKLEAEASRVIGDVQLAKAAGKAQPHQSRYPGAVSFMALNKKQRRSLVDSILLKPSSKGVSEIESQLSECLRTYPADQREKLAARVCEWWDRQILLSMCGDRPRYIQRGELIEHLAEFSAALQTDALVESFASKKPPETFQTDEMLSKQCALVNAPTSLVYKARVSEWQARNQRSEWQSESPSKHSRILDFDQRLIIEWEFQHAPACDSVALGDEAQLSKAGLQVLNWALGDAAQVVGSIDRGVTSPFYVRGSYQVLAIEGKVGWHPEYRTRLGFGS